MAFGLKVAGADLAYKGGMFNGTRYLALLSAEKVELSTTTHGGYSRVAMALADWVKDGAAYENKAQELFGPPTGAAWPAIVGYALYSASTGGNLLANIDTTDTGAPGIGASVGALAETIGYAFSGGSLTTAGSLKCLDEGLLSGTRHLILHNASTPTQADSMGGSGSEDGNHINTDGTVGAASGKTPVSVGVAAGDWTLDTQSSTRRRARNNKNLNYGIQVADLPDPMSVTLRDGNAANSDILWHWPVTSPDPNLGDALNWAANALAIELNFTAA